MLSNLEKQLAKLIKTLLPKINIITTFDEKAPKAFFPQAPGAISQSVESSLQDGLIHSIISEDESVCVSSCKSQGCIKLLRNRKFSPLVKYNINRVSLSQDYVP